MIVAATSSTCPGCACDGTDDCSSCLQLVFGDTIETLCCHSPAETAICQIKRPARVLRQCWGTGTNTKTYAARDDLVAVYKDGACDWLVLTTQAMPEVLDLCIYTDCSGPPASYAFACGTSLCRDGFGSGLGGLSPCDNRWSLYRDGVAAADPERRWWADIQCYNSGSKLTYTDFPFSPTTAGSPCGGHSAIVADTYWLHDYFLATVHRRITWTLDCDSGNFTTGDSGLACLVPLTISFFGAGVPLFEMDLYMAMDEDRWGDYAGLAAFTTAALQFICDIRNSVDPNQSDIDEIFAHPALLLTTTDWRSRQNTDDAANLAAYPTEYASCTAQTDTLGVARKKCWPAIQPELVRSTITSLQADCLPASTGSMEADYEWMIRRNTYMRPRPGGWMIACNGGEPTGCHTNTVFEDSCIRYDGFPFGTPSESCSGVCAGLAVAACGVATQCQYADGVASCDGILFSYRETQFLSCTAYYTCTVAPGGDCAADGGCQAYYLYETYRNEAYIYTINKVCGEGREYVCRSQASTSSAPVWGTIVGAQMMARNACRNIAIYLGTDSEWACINNFDQCGSTCSTTSCPGAAYQAMPASQYDDSPCGTYGIFGCPNTLDPCEDVCFTAPACSGSCDWLATIGGCITAPSDPCP